MQRRGYIPSTDMHTPRLARGHGRGIRNARTHPGKPACLEPTCERNMRTGGTPHFTTSESTRTHRLARPMQEGTGESNTTPGRTAA